MENIGIYLMGVQIVLISTIIYILYRTIKVLNILSDSYQDIIHKSVDKIVTNSSQNIYDQNTLITQAINTLQEQVKNNNIEIVQKINETRIQLNDTIIKLNDTINSVVKLD